MKHQTPADQYALGLSALYGARAAAGVPYGKGPYGPVTAAQYLDALTPADTLMPRSYALPAKRGVTVVLNLDFGDLTITIGDYVTTIPMPPEYVSGLLAEVTKQGLE